MDRGGEPVDRAHRGGVGQLQLLVQLVPNHHVVVVVIVVGGGGEAVRRADRVGGALCGEARHRPQPHNHRVRLLKRPQRVSNLRKLFGPKKKRSIVIHIHCTSFHLEFCSHDRDNVTCSHSCCFSWQQPSKILWHLMPRRCLAHLLDWRGCKDSMNKQNKQKLREKLTWLG